MDGRLGVAAAGWLLLVATVAGAGLASPAVDSGAVSRAATDWEADGTATPVASSGADADPAVAGVVQETDSTVTRITLAPNGSATWQVQIRTRLTSDADVEEYEAFQERFRENTSAFLDPFRERMRGVVRDASNETDRPMEARNFRAETTIQTVPRRWGVVTYEFAWIHFAAHDGESLVVGDVFRGQFFLTENDTLSVVAPEGYAVTDADPPPGETDPGLVRWSGPRGFPDDTPAVRVEPVTPTASSGGTATPIAGTDGPARTTGPGGTDDPSGTDGPGDTASASGTTAPPGSGSGSGLPLAAGVLVVGLLAVGVYRIYVGGDGRLPWEEDPSPEPNAGSVPGTDTGSGADGTGEGAAAGAGAPAVDPGPVLTDADRVENLLTDAGGQLRQSEIVEGLDWSKSKTSRVLSDMADEDRIEKLRIGRENVIRLQADDGDGGDWTDGAGAADGSDGTDDADGTDSGK